MKRGSLEILLCEKPIHLPMAKDCRGQGPQSFTQLCKTFELFKRNPYVPEIFFVV